MYSLLYYSYFLLVIGEEKKSNLWFSVPNDFDSDSQIDDVVKIGALVEAQISIAKRLLRWLLLTLVNDLKLAPWTYHETSLANSNIESREASDWLLAANLVTADDADLV